MRRFFAFEQEEAGFLMEAAEINKMNTVERLRAMEALWDALIHEDGEPASREWHGDILAERKQLTQSGERLFYERRQAGIGDDFWDSLLSEME